MFFVHHMQERFHQLDVLHSFHFYRLSAQAVLQAKRDALQIYIARRRLQLSKKAPRTSIFQFYITSKHYSQPYMVYLRDRMAALLPQTPRRIKTFLVRLTLILWLFSASFLVYFYNTSVFGEDLSGLTVTQFDFMLKGMYPRSEKLRGTHTHSSNYNYLLHKSPIYDFLRNNDFDQRCDKYFRTLLYRDSEWKIDPHTDFSYIKGNYQLVENYIKDRQKEWKDSGEEGELSEKTLEEDYNYAKALYREDEQTLHDYLSHLKIFNKCFLTRDSHMASDSAFISKQRQNLTEMNFQMAPSKFSMTEMYHGFKSMSCATIERKLYSWVSRKSPVYERWDGKIVRIPVAGGKTTDKCFLLTLRSFLKGKGIVLSIADKHLDDIVRLIRLLRALRNTLPIQIVYYDNVSDDTKKTIIKAARSKFENHPGQEVWFVDVKEAVTEEYLYKFGGFGNKILATLFNSFEEMMLIDADTVMLESPEFFFSMKKYLRTGTAFFKDRATFEFRPKDDLIFFKKLLPSVLDTAIFNIPQTSEQALLTEFFMGLSHYMESGLVVINRATHFEQPLIMAQLNFYSTVQNRIYGDKELFWLSLVISGDENFAFNKHFAAAIGLLTPELERSGDVGRDKVFKSKEICSNHPAHINDEDDHSLLWFNSGFRHCGKNSEVRFLEEFNFKKRYKFLKTVESFKTFFESKVIIKNAIIPPVTLNENVGKNNENEPERPWLNLREYCYGYTWCAYSLMGGDLNRDGEVFDTQIKGTLIEFTDREINRFKELGDVWTSNYEFTEPI